MANNIDVKDASAATQTLKTTDNAGTHTPHHNVDDLPGAAAEGGALPSLFLVVAGDDGTDVHPIQVDASGNLKVIQQPNDGVDIGDVDVASLPGTGAEGAALPGEVLVVAGDDGTDIHTLQIDDSSGGLKAILQANSGVDIGDVDATLAAAENHVGQVGASDEVVEITATLDNSGAYAAGDVLFDTQEIAGAARVNGGVVILQSVTILDKDDQAAELDLVFLEAATSIGTENSAVSISDADAEDILGIVNVPTDDYADLIASQVATTTAVGLEMKAAAGTTSLYVAGITRGTPTHSTSGMVLKFAFLRS